MNLQHIMLDRKFQHNILEIGAPVYELLAYYVGTPAHYEIPPCYSGSSHVKIRTPTYYARIFSKI